MTNRLQLFTEIRNAVEKEVGLTVDVFWDGKNPCAMGALVPSEKREFTDYIHHIEKMFNTDYFKNEVFIEIVTKNNRYLGTPEERRLGMLAWLDAEIASIKTVEGSDLPVPEFANVLEKV